jgi:hypothetical protein
VTILGGTQTALNFCCKQLLISVLQAATLAADPKHKCSGNITGLIGGIEFHL